MNISSAIIQGAKFLKESFIKNPLLDSELLIRKRENIYYLILREILI